MRRKKNNRVQQIDHFLNVSSLVIHFYVIIINCHYCRGMIRVWNISINWGVQYCWSFFNFFFLFCSFNDGPTNSFYCMRVHAHVHPLDKAKHLFLHICIFYIQKERCILIASFVFPSLYRYMKTLRYSREKASFCLPIYAIIVIVLENRQIASIWTWLHVSVESGVGALCKHINYMIFNPNSGASAVLIWLSVFLLFSSTRMLLSTVW